jgi:type III pantothenate kinase
MGRSDEIPTVLACDVGNSTIHFAAVCGEEVASPQDMRMGELNGLGDAMRKTWVSMPEPKKVVAASVNPSGLKALEAAAEDAFGESVLVIGRDLPLPMETDLDDPEAVGVDRLCAAAAAFDHLGVACVVADFGTAATVDCVNADGVFLGGAILPGLQMGARSLATQTAQLPHVDITEPTWVFGKDTAQAITGGLVIGLRGALRELVEAYATELGHWPVVVITGGDAKHICRNPNESQLVQAQVDHLAIRGVAIAYYKTLLK